MSNYYLALGIERDADLNKIKQAYRICCKRYHPDSGSSEGNKQHFLRIQEAYETLSDQKKRREYDRRLEEREKDGPQRSFSGWDEPRQPGRPEQMSASAQRWHPRSAGRVRRFAGGSPFGFPHSTRTFERISSLLDEFFGGFVPGFFDDPFSTEKELYAELILSPEEARAGGELPIDVPVLIPCHSCRGSGIRSGGVCMDCYGEGSFRTTRSFRLHVPAGIFDGAQTRVSLEGIGIPDIYLNVDITVTM